MSLTDIKINLPQLPQDKANHYVYGSAIFAVMFLITRHPGIALGTVTLAAFAKEGLDWLGNYLEIKAGQPTTHGVDFWDAVATIAGGFIPFVMAQFF